MELLLSYVAAFPLQSMPVFCGAYARVTVLQRKKKSCNEYLAFIVLQGLEIYKYI